MKFLDILLALSLFTGSQAAFLRDEPKSKLTELKEELQEYTRNINGVWNAKLLLMRGSELGQQLELYIEYNVEQVKRSWNKLQNKMPAEMVGAYNLAGTVSIAVALKTFATLKKLREKVTPAVEDLYEHLHPVWAPHAAPFLETARAHAEPLGARVQEMDAELNRRLQSGLEELTAWLVPYAKRVRSWWQEFQKSLKPFADQAQEWLGQAVEATKGSWRPYVAPVWEVCTQYSIVLYDLFIREQ